MARTEGSMNAKLIALVDTIKRADYGAAIVGLKEFLAAEPEHEIALGLLASSYFQIGSRDRARSAYEQLLAAHPANALARFQLGMLRLADDPRESLVLWAPLLEAEAEFMAHFHSALAHVQLGESEAARPLLEHAAKYMPDGHPLRAQLDRMRLAVDSITSGATRYSR